ncbi:MAG: hypothetical protein JXB49_09940 [Bacteroidales bacterium]|nr:hypothetical protein [Bacteroidales bacterium]
MYQIEDKYIDLLKELVNLGVGNGSYILNAMLSSHIKLEVPEVEILQYKDMEKHIQSFGNKKLDVIYLPFHGHIAGSAQIIIPHESTKTLVSKISAPNTTLTQYVIIDSIKEVGNIIINSILGTISNNIYFHLDYSVPIFYEGSLTNLLLKRERDAKSRYLLAQTIFTINELDISGSIVLLLKEEAFDELIQAMNVYLIENGIVAA